MSLLTAFISAPDMVAWLDRDDPQHTMTGFRLRIEVDAEATLLTSNYEIAKAALELQRRHGIEGPRVLLREFVPFLHIEWCTQRDHETAVEVLLAGEADPGDLVTCVSAEIMRRTGTKPSF